MRANVSLTKSPRVIPAGTRVEITGHPFYAGIRGILAYNGPVAMVRHSTPVGPGWARVNLTQVRDYR